MIVHAHPSAKELVSTYHPQFHLKRNFKHSNIRNIAIMVKILEKEIGTIGYGLMGLWFPLKS